MLYACIFVLCVSDILLENVKCSRNVAIEMSNLSIGDLVFKLEPEQKRIVRCIEKAKKQYVNNKYAVIFNTKCFAYIYLPVIRAERRHAMMKPLQYRHDHC